MRDPNGQRVRRTTVAAIAVVGFAACSSTQGATRIEDSVLPTQLEAKDGPSVPTAPSSAVQLVDVVKGLALAADQSVVVVDVRTPAEFAEGHLDRAELVDFNDAEFREQIAQFDRSATYLVYCHSGNRSGQATAIMAELGFANVYDLDGGIGAWQAAGAPIVK